MLLEQMLRMAQQRSGEKKKPSAATRLNCLGLLEGRGGQRKKQDLSSDLPKVAVAIFLTILGLCVLVSSRGDRRWDVCRCSWAQDMAEGWLCSVSVGHGYVISGTSPQQNFLKIGKGRGLLQGCVSLNVSKEGREQGHRPEWGLKNIRGEMSLRCFT